jgi:hypothetical protein
MKTTLLAACVSALVAPLALAWDAHGHRTIALLAVDRLEVDLAKPAAAMPAPAPVNDGGAKAPPSPPLPDAERLAWLFTPETRAQIGYQSGEPDRFRAIRANQLKHENDTEHYIDVEDLADYGLTLSTVPPLRYEYIRVLVIARHEHPENIPPINPKLDAASTLGWPGLLPHAACEHYYKLVSSFRQIRVLDALNDSSRTQQIAAARSNVIYEMGILAHLIGDGAQPLHTTKHHHGWVGPNPDNFTTNRGFHAYIDGTILGIHNLGYDTLRTVPNTITRTINQDEPWTDILNYIQDSFDHVRPLYELHKADTLKQEPGKAFITERLQDGASMLGALYTGAWRASAMEEKSSSDFIKFDGPSKPEPNPLTTPRPNP